MLASLSGPIFQVGALKPALADDRRLGLLMRVTATVLDLGRSKPSER